MSVEKFDIINQHVSPPSPPTEQKEILPQQQFFKRFSAKQNVLNKK
jgi:hypothetical protein